MKNEKGEAVSRETAPLTALERTLLSQMFRFGWYLNHHAALYSTGGRTSSDDYVGHIDSGSFDLLRDHGYILPIVQHSGGYRYFANADLFSVSGEVGHNGGKFQGSLKIALPGSTGAPGATISEPVTKDTETTNP